MDGSLDRRLLPFGADAGDEMLVFDLDRGDDAVFMLPCIGMSDEEPIELIDSFQRLIERIHSTED